MTRVCPKCGCVVAQGGAFCATCGESLPVSVNLEKSPASSSANEHDIMPSAQGNFQRTAYTVPQPQPIPTSGVGTGNYTQYGNTPAVNERELTLGQWVGTIILTTWFSIISLILCIVWAASSDTPTSKKRYCQAVLIVHCILIGVAIVSSLALAGIFATIGAALTDAFGGSFATEALSAAGGDIYI